MIVQAYVFVAGAFYLPRVGNLYYALTHSPEPLTDEFSHALSWEAATDRFVAAGSISAAEAEAMEDYVKTKADEPDWEMDEHHREHLKELGLFDEEDNPGEEYISRQ